MISDLIYTSRGFLISNQVKFRPTCSLSGLSATGFYIRSFCYLINALTSIKSIIKLVTFNKADVRIKKKS